MIISASMRTDIPAFFSEWFYNRIEAGFVDVLNPYDRKGKSYYRYSLSPDVVDALSFCTKNPTRMISDKRFIKLQGVYPMLWGMTINAYDRSIEPNVIGVQEAISAFQKLSNLVGKERVGWRYDPICFINNETSMHNIDNHIRGFTYIASKLCGYTDKVVISFLDHYEKVKSRTLRISRPEMVNMVHLVRKMADIAYDFGMVLYLCHDEIEYIDSKNVVQNSCLTIEEVNKRLGLNLAKPSKSSTREGCNCILGGDIGQYNTCGHQCIYCYANGNVAGFYDNAIKHFEKSSCLIGYVTESSEIKNVAQESWKVR